MRLFVAVNFDENLKRTVASTVRELKSRAVSGVFTHDENCHLTLAFIGETQNIKGAKEAVKYASENSKGAITLATTHIDRFRRDAREGDIYFLGVAENKGLFRLADNVAAELRKQSFEIESRSFKPHITLGRQVKTKEDITFDVPSTEMNVSRVSLMKSERINGKLTYTEIYGADLIK